MKKEKTVKTHTRKTKSGKTVTVKQHTAKYDAADQAKDIVKKAGAGAELEKVKKAKMQEDPYKDFDFTAEEFAEWYEGTGSKADKKVEKALRKALGRKAYDELNDAAADSYKKGGAAKFFTSEVKDASERHTASVKGAKRYPNEDASTKGSSSIKSDNGELPTFNSKRAANKWLKDNGFTIDAVGYAHKNGLVVGRVEEKNGKFVLPKDASLSDKEIKQRIKGMEEFGNLLDKGGARYASAKVTTPRSIDSRIDLAAAKLERKGWKLHATSIGDETTIHATAPDGSYYEFRRTREGVARTLEDLVNPKKAESVKKIGLVYKGTKKTAESKSKTPKEPKSKAPKQETSADLHRRAVLLKMKEGESVTFYDVMGRKHEATKKGGELLISRVLTTGRKEPYKSMNGPELRYALSRIDEKLSKGKESKSKPRKQKTSVKPDKEGYEKIKVGPDYPAGTFYVKNGQLYHEANGKMRKVTKRELADFRESQRGVPRRPKRKKNTPEEDAALDAALAEIRERNKQPYQVSRKL